MTSTRQITGLILFAIYLVVYGGFVLLNAFAPEVMQTKPMLGVNLAIISGFGLILLAFGMAIAYGFISARGAIEQRATEGTPREPAP
jgi:uncharacterized membrane protein (DUF485 family)